MEQGEKIGPENYKITPEIKQKAKAIALFMGGDYNMTVGIGPWGSGWHWDFVKNHVNLDPKDLATEPEDLIKGIAAHEGNHRAISRTESLMDLWQEQGFSFCVNAVEDPRANQGGMKFNPGSRDWIQTYIERDLGPDGGLDYEGIERNAKSKLGYVPDFMKWGSEIIRFWHEKEFVGGLETEEEKKQFASNVRSEKVRDAVAKTVDFFEKYYKTLPDTKDEMEILAKAREAGLNFVDNIWPICKELVDKSYEDHSMVKMVEDMMNQKGQNQQGKGQGPSMPSDVQKDIEQAQKEKGKESKDGGKGKSQKEEKGKGDNSSASGQTAKNKSNENQEQGSGAGKIPWDELPEKTKQKIKDMFNSLPKDKQDEYRQKAKEDMEQTEDDANEKLRGKMNNPQYTKTHKEEKDEEAKREEQAKEEQYSKELIQKIIKESQRALEKIPEDPYGHFMDLPEVDSIRRQMERDFKKIFEPTEDPEVRITSFGMHPSMRKAMQAEADPRKLNIFESKGKPTEKKYRFFILVDMSSSMAGEKMEETFKALIPIAENLNRFGIEFQIAGFTTGLPKGVLKIYKPFDIKKLTKDTRNEMGKIMREGMGSTPTSMATEISVKLLKKRMAQSKIDHNYFITLTDGQPDEGVEQLLQYIKRIRKDRSFVTAGLGIGPQTDFVNHSYPVLPTEVKTAIARQLGKSEDEISNSFADSSDFGRAFAIIIGYMIRRPELFFK